MIRAYCFYSFGGYKDMYLGNLDANSSSVYYLPLLSIMKKRGLAEEVQKISELESLDKIQIISRNSTYDFPSECKSLFSHGGYVVMYRTLNDGSVCLAIRNLYGSMKDEEGRSTPFTILFVANTPSDIDLMDNVATFCIHNSHKLNDIISPTIIYDSKANGLRADISKIYEWIILCPESKKFIHTPGVVDYIMIGSLSYFHIILEEHNIKREFVNAAILQNGHIRYGELAIKEDCDENTENMPAVSCDMHPINDGN